MSQDRVVHRGRIVTGHGTFPGGEYLALNGVGFQLVRVDSYVGAVCRIDSLGHFSPHKFLINGKEFTVFVSNAFRDDSNSVLENRVVLAMRRGRSMMNLLFSVPLPPTIDRMDDSNGRSIEL